MRGDGVGTGGSQSASNGGSANAGNAGSDGEGGSGMPSGGSGSGEGGSEMADNGGSGGGGGGGSDCDATGILIASCGSASCHGGSIGSFAQDEASILNAVGQPATLNASCGSGVLIDDSDYTQGVLYNKTFTTTCGSQMPLGPALSADDLTCVEDFLAALEQ